MFKDSKYDVYFQSASNNLLDTCNLYNHLLYWLNQPINLIKVLGHCNEYARNVVTSFCLSNWRM